MSGLTRQKGLFRRFKKEDRERLDEVLKLLVIEHLKDKNITSLSGGQTQRVFIVRALINDPSILVLDEPTVCFDNKHFKEFYEVLLMLRKRPVAILPVTHDIGADAD